MSIENAIQQVKNLISDRLILSKSIRAEHGSSETLFPVFLPDAVAYVENTTEVSDIMRICNNERCPVVAWGTGTSLEGHALPVRGGITLNMMNMNKIIRVNLEDMDAVLQPGVQREQLNEDLRASGLFFSVDPGANASLGGMAATRASGTTSVRYGTMRENILALEVVMSDGRIIRTGNRARKSASGYDLTNLIIGSEGTLGIITELTVKLHGRPESISAAVCSFPDFRLAVDTVISTIQAGIPIARMEFIDSASIEVMNRYKKETLEHKPYLFMEFHGSSTSVDEQVALVQEIATENQASDFQWSNREEERKKLWEMRHHAFYAYKAYYSNCSPIVTDACVPISNLAEMVDKTQKDIAESGLKGPILGHVGDGNFHSTLLVRKNNKNDLEIARALANKMALRSLELGGTISGEHGIGLGKIKFMEKEHKLAWDVMGDIKKALDPHGILNPGKIVKSEYN